MLKTCKESLFLFILLSSNIIFGLRRFTFICLGCCFGFILYFCIIKIQEMKKDLKIRKFLTFEEYNNYEDAKENVIKTKGDIAILKMVNDYLSGTFTNKSDYPIPKKNRFLMESFYDKYGNIDPESLLSD